MRLEEIAGDRGPGVGHRDHRRPLPQRREGLDLDAERVPDAALRVGDLPELPRALRRRQREDRHRLAQRVLGQPEHRRAEAVAVLELGEEAGALDEVEHGARIAWRDRTFPAARGST